MTSAQERPGTPAPRPPRWQARRLLLLVAVPLAVLLLVALAYLRGGRTVETDNAYVKADKVAVGTQVAGTVREVLVRENQVVQAGQPLLRLDPAQFQLAVAKAEARLAQARTDLAALQASHREKQAEIALARTRQAFAARQQQRQADLLRQNFISAAGFDEARLGTEVAAQQIVALERDLQRIAETLGGSVTAPPQRHPAYLSALAELEHARLDLARIDVTAPLDGIVSKPPKVGQYLATGSMALTLIAQGPLWIEANFPETDLTHVRAGQPVTVHIDTYPGALWRGEVESLSPATGAEFSVIPAQNATGNWVKIAQRVPVRIRVEPRAGQPALRAGLSARVEIDTGHRRRLLGLSL